MLEMEIIESKLIQLTMIYMGHIGLPFIPAFLSMKSITTVGREMQSNEY